MKNSNELIPLKIIASGTALPENKVYSSDLDLRLNKPSGFVEKHSGIEYRYHSDYQASQAKLAVDALHDTLKTHQIQPDSIDLLISASAIPIQALPYSAAHILKVSRLKAGIACFDINSSCVSFISALSVASGLLATRQYRRIAIVSAEMASRGIDWSHQESSLIFGDGAACMIVERGDGQSGIVTYKHETYPEGLELCEVRAGGTRKNLRAGMEDSDFLFQMQGKPLFKLTASLIEGFTERVLASANLEMSDIDTVVPHQASHLGLKHIRNRLNIRDERFMNIYRYRGNQVAASIPSALHEAMITDRYYGRDYVMLLGTAAGLSLSEMILRP
ncbi:3-oxoacyl-[acyl-carrier-protein] synthase III C-terminal domain-containing protein [Xenorhabdus sp. XENO-10]|uniref:3-oxoacyl-[acyl-carrier-protein] synthase III C-terminal domain-containing protein n=1 Tax=Xenorhabdus yunnanensis TaxID=3025878 RepID=A0ABT5LDR8_9GAMM|nr:3-oxoacyl-[acyl-carrier-protein] synthase III C-terminal domain-containing protein [Xenorhabdus yunnanensis]MDC9589251.1 3-oxoacyl-[acyl-carrier-protein] synthase III C-terminal domain-containing protein [Xenorhabdus yunnanensis]